MKQLWQEIKNWIAEKIILFFVGTEIGKNAMEQYLETSNLASKAMKKSNNLESRVKNAEGLFELAADVRPEFGTTGSWAVICIAGKPEYVRFIRLNQGDMREIARFLKHFSPSHRPPQTVSFQPLLN